MELLSTPLQSKPTAHDHQGVVFGLGFRSSGLRIRVPAGLHPVRTPDTSSFSTSQPEKFNTSEGRSMPEDPIQAVIRNMSQLPQDSEVKIVNSF